MESSGPLSATCYDVRRRWRPDPMSISAPRDFHYVRGAVCDAKMLLGDRRWSLYGLDERKRRAIFVKVPDAAVLDEAPFYYQAQYRHAEQAALVDFPQFHELASASRAFHGEGRPKCVLIHSVGRCGSTLLSRMFARSPACLSLSEPDLHTHLVCGEWADDEKLALAKSGTQLCWKEPAETTRTHLVLKFRSFCIEVGKMLHDAMPTAANVFLYRPLEKVVASGMGAFAYRGAPLWWIEQFTRLAPLRPIAAAALRANMPLGRRMFPLLSQFTPGELARLGPIALLGIAWVSAMQRCRWLQEQGVAMIPLVYDDLVAGPREMLTSLLARCGLPEENVSPALTALDDDSQAGTVLDRQRRRKYELSARDREILAEVLRRQSDIDRGDFRLPGTLS